MASDFDSLWEQNVTKLDDAVDSVLGDRIRYALDGETYLIQPAFVIVEANGETDIAGLDDIAERRRIKIRKSIVDMPSLSHRIQHPKLGEGTFRPTNSLPETEGRYWLFDVQKVG